MAEPVVEMIHRMAVAGYPVVTVSPMQPAPRRPRGSALLLVGDDAPEWQHARGPGAFDRAALTPWFGHLAPGVLAIFADGWAPDAYAAVACVAPATRGGAVIIGTTSAGFDAWLELGKRLAPRAQMLCIRPPPPDAPHCNSVAVEALKQPRRGWW